MREEAERKAKLLQTEEEATDKQKKHEFEKARLAFKQKLKRFKLTSQQRQEEERERHSSDLEKFERQMQVHEKVYEIPPQQV